MLEKTIRDSGLFTQVEPEWWADRYKSVTYVNLSRGVVIKVARTTPTTGQVSFDYGQSTYYFSGYYTEEELTKWWFPVMRSDKAWKIHVDNTIAGEGDITLALDYI